MTLEKQTVVIIGGASGIGLATAKAAQAAGASVTLLDINAVGLPTASQAVPGSHTGVLDVNDEAAVNAAFAAFNHIDHIYIAAGSTKLGSILAEESVNNQLQQFTTRIWGSVYVVRAAMPKMRPGGSITFTGGLSTDRPVAGVWVSNIATAAVEQLARALALDLAPVRFNAVAPGVTDTPMWDTVLGSAKQERMAEMVNTRAVIKRPVTPEEVAAAVVLLMAVEAITGEVVHVDGGARLT